MMQELLIDAMYINNSGGKILLDYLIEELEKSEKQIFYLLDKRVENNCPKINIKKNTLVFLDASLLNRNRFYREHKNRFTTVLAFGNLPPNIRLKAKVFTYFHQDLYINLPSNTIVKTKIIFFFKRLIFKYFIKNSDLWLLQTHLIKSNFERRFSVDPSKVLVLPFYDSIKETEKVDIKRKKQSYLYVSNAPEHKNHRRLINSFCAFYDQSKSGTLTITVGREFTDLLVLIEDKKKKGYPIINIGFIPRESLSKIYKSSEYLIYPSLAESFGLCLLEAIENGCKVLGADLPYTYAVCKPTLVFDPLNENSITDALSLSLQNNLQPSVAKVTNNIDELISIL